MVGSIHIFMVMLLMVFANNSKWVNGNTIRITSTNNDDRDNYQKLLDDIPSINFPQSSSSLLSVKRPDEQESNENVGYRCPIKKLHNLRLPLVDDYVQPPIDDDVPVMEQTLNSKPKRSFLIDCRPLLKKQFMTLQNGRSKYSLNIVLKT
ncbi:hypothetical protein RDWZM_003518 [Blomia tropicalis]|uniref:Uncharacterized protein n=1 Tax=Blomia tropicalis TaxID=40697 RepID=A0A9Q0MF56_BLOTA|nr:hypothetical protein RDWZM_003518 [Blomia tropicalis]